MIAANRSGPVLLNGPPGTEPVLKDIGLLLEQGGVSTSTHLGPLESIASSAMWGEVEVLVSMAAQCAYADLGKANSLKGIVSPVIGIEKIDVAAASQRGIPVIRGESRQNYESMAEATIMLLLALFLNLPGSMRECADVDYRSPFPRTRLGGKCVGIIGHGNIAKAVIQRLAAWDVALLVHRRSRRPPLSAGSDVSLFELLRRSDALVILCPLTTETHKLIGEAELKALKPGAHIVNTARGGIIDEDALLANAGRLGGIALDVFDREPLSAASKLRTLSNAILTPHNIGHTIESQREIRQIAAHNVLELLNGRIPSGAVNREEIAEWAARHAAAPSGRS